jgi:hypothetical protein
LGMMMRRKPMQVQDDEKDEDSAKDLLGNP